MATLNIDGMTCGHCVRAVTDAVHAAAPGATVQVDLPAGIATVTAAGDLPLERIVAAIEEEGYAVTSFARD